MNEAVFKGLAHGPSQEPTQTQHLHLASVGTPRALLQRIGLICLASATITVLAVHDGKCHVCCRQLGSGVRDAGSQR